YRAQFLRGLVVQVLQRQVLVAAAEHHHFHVRGSAAVPVARSVRRGFQYFELRVGQRRERALDLGAPALFLAHQKDSQRSTPFLGFSTQHEPSLLKSPLVRNAAWLRQAPESARYGCPRGSYSRCRDS